MKWYSVNKYKPAATCTDVLVRTKAGRVIMASNNEVLDGPYQWISFYDEILTDVTHFMIIEPIEIENNQ